MTSNRFRRLSILAILTACDSESASRNADRGESQPTPALPAVELARSYGLEIRPDVLDGVPIRVVDAKTGKPVADALVVSVSESEFTYWDAGDGGITWNARSLLKHSGRAYVTSSDGVARIEAPREPRAVFVWHGGDFGRTTFEVHDRAEHVVSLAPRALIVEVVDKTGRPQPGIPVQLGKCALEPMSVGTTVGITGPDGRFAIPALELERAVHRTCGRRALVMLGVPVSGFESIAIDAPQLEPVRFVLPDCGEVDLDLQTSHPWPPGNDHAPWPRFRLSVETAKLGARCGLERRRETVPESERSLIQPIDHPPYRLEHVEVGTTLWFNLEILENNSSRTFERLKAYGVDGLATEGIEGPTRAGEVRHILVKSARLGEPVEKVMAKDEPNSTVERLQEETDAEDRAREREFEEGYRVSSSLDLSVLLDVEIEPCWLSVRLDDNREPNEHDSCPWIDVNGRATMRRVSAGKHSVTITSRRLSNDYAEVPICRIEDVEVGPSQHLRDPRLQNIDLRGKLRVHRYEITDGDGRPLSGFIRLTRDGDRNFADEIWFEDGHVSFLTGVDDGVRASVAVNRFRKLALDLRSSEPAGALRRVFMQQGIGIHLALDKSLKLPDEPHDSIYIGVSEMPHWFESFEELRTVELRPGADLKFKLAEPGDWTVIFLRSHDDGSGEPTVSECKSVETTISVMDSEMGFQSVQYLTLSPDRDCWDALIQSLAR